MKFNVKVFEEYYHQRNSERMKSLAYTYCSNVTYVDERDYKELIVLLNAIIEKIYEIKERDVQEAFFDVLIGAINFNFEKYEGLNECIELIIKKIELLHMDSWTLAESLLVISATMDKKYHHIMEGYMHHEDDYVRDVVMEYMTDTVL